MKSKFFLSLLLISAFLFRNALELVAQEKPIQQVSIENKIGFKKGLLGNKLDYQLLPTDGRKFVLKITNSKLSDFDVKIYDIIGNLILSDDLSEENNGEKEYDFSDRKTKIFVVKVGSGEENLTKKVTI
jgi:hypothetical protein